MSAIYLTESDVEAVLDAPAAIEAVGEAFARLAAGEAHNTPRVRASAPGVVLHSMIAAAGYLDLVGWKCYTTTRAGARFWVALADRETGTLVAWIEANRLGQMRTGAATAVAVQYMAAPATSELGLFGAGWQAESQLRSIAAVLSLREAFVYSRDSDRRTVFADRMSDSLAIRVTPVDRPQEAAEDLPLVVTATSSKAPVFDGSWLAPDALVCAVGSNYLGKAEIDAATVRRADIIVCDSVEACRSEAGDFVDALEKGVFDWPRAVELADVVAGRAVGRSHAAGVSLFKSVGLAIEDVAVAAVVVRRARERGLGSPLPFC